MSCEVGRDAKKDRDGGLFGAYSPYFYSSNSGKMNCIGAAFFSVIGACGYGVRGSPGRPGPPQNVGNGLTHLLRLRAIRATLRSPQGFDQIQL